VAHIRVAATRYYDAGTGGVIEPRSRVAYGRLTDDIAVEFLEVDRAGPVPLVWQLAEGGVETAHIGHWVTETAPVARRLLADGGRIVMARATPSGVGALTPVTDCELDAVPDSLDACYILTRARQIVELVPGRIWSGRLVDTFGPQSTAVIPRPPAGLTEV